MAIILKFFIFFLFLSSYSSIVKSNIISNCEDCGKIGGDLGTIYPKDPIFYRSNFEMKCAMKPGSFDTKTFTVNFHQGFFNSNYIWGWNNTEQFLFGYFTEDRVLRIDAIRRDKKRGRTYRSYFIDSSKKEIRKIFKNEIVGTRVSGRGKDRKCVLRSYGMKYVKQNDNCLNDKVCLRATIDTLKTFEATQFQASQYFSKAGYNLTSRFNFSDALTDLTIKKTMLDKQPKVIIKEDEESKRLVEQKSKELEQEKARRIAEEKERKILEAKTRKLAEEKRLAELKAKKRTEDIAKEVAAEKQKKIEEERALRKAEELKRKEAEERTKKIALEKKLAEERAKREAKERALKLAEERKRTEEVAKRLEQERLKAELKTKKLEKVQQIQLAALEKEKAEKQKLILEEKKKRDELEKKLAALEEENKANRSKGNKVYKAKLPPEWMPFQNKMSIQQEQFCQLTNRFFKDMDKAINSGNDIKINIVHQERQENLDGLLPSGKINNWIFKVVKIEQVDDGSAAVVLSLHCKSFVGSGQIYTKSTWRKKSNKEWRATIPRDDRRFRELAKLDRGQFILGSGTLLEINAFKPGQIETFYASQQIGEHPLTKDLNLEGELFLADLSYIAALN